MDEWQQVEEDTHSVDAVVEDVQAALDDDLHNQAGTPAEEKQDYDQDEHLDDLLSGFFHVPDV